MRSGGEFEHYNNTFHYVPDSSAVGLSVLLGRLGRPFESDENLAPDQQLQATVHYGWKAAVVVVDPTAHDDGQKVMMNHDTLVGNPLPLLSALVGQINSSQTLGPYSISVDPIFEASSFFAFAKENEGDITSLTFDLTVPNMFGGSDGLSTWLRDTNRQENAESVTLKLKNREGLKADTPDVREAVDYATKGGGRVKATTRRGKQFDSKDRAKTTKLAGDDTDGTLLQRVVRELTKLVK